MKRNLLIVFLFVLCAASITAADHLNIYASGLRLHGATPAEQVTGENQVHIDYFLNAPATDLKFVLLDTDGNTLQEFTIPAETNSTDNYAKGAHSDVVVDLSSYIGGNNTYKWAIKATGSTVSTYAKITDTSAKYQFYGPRGVAVDNSFESDYFGNIYVTNFNSGGGLGTGDNKDRNTTTGVYAFDAGLNALNSSAYTGGLTWGTNSGIQWAIARPCVGPDGTVYITSGSATNSGVWMMNPANPSASFSPVFGGTHSSTGTTKNGNVTIHNSILHCYVDGLGSERKLYTYDLTTASTGGDILRYDIGNLESVWTAAQSATIYNDASNGNKITNGDCSIASDGNGGWWMCQYRAGTGDADVPCLIHITNGSIDYNSGTTIKTTYCGGMAVSADGSLLAIGTTQSNIDIYSVTYNAKNVPTLTKKSFSVSWPFSTSTYSRWAKGLAFDVANNLYAVDNNKEIFTAFAINGSTTFTTKAASSRTIVLGPAIDVTGVSLDQDSKTLVKGQSFTLTATVAPSNATNKNVTWTSTDPTIATVSDGEVTALKKGTTTIRVTTQDGSFTDECAVTVELMHGTYNIGGASAHYATLADACEAIDNIGIDGNTTLLICSDLTETRNIGLVNSTDYSITIRPDADADRIISFTKTTDNSGPSGAFIIGCTMALTNIDRPTNNIIIDGYAEGASTRRLSFEITSGFGSSWGPIIYYGQISGCVLRNAKVINTNPGAKTSYTIMLRPYANSTHTPQGVIIENNYIEAKTHSLGTGIYLYGDQASGENGYPHDIQIKNNEIVAKLRGIMISKSKDITMDGNTFRIQNGTSGYITSAIHATNQKGEINVRCNKFIENISLNAVDGNANGHVACGMQTITASGGATLWTIENNYFAGMDVTASGVTTKNVRHDYIYCSDSCVIRHNTFYMPSLTYKPATELVGTEAITCVWLANSKKHHVKNNIFVSAETEANNSLIRGTINSNVSSNIYYHNGGNCAIVAGAATYTTWDDFDDVADAGSKWASPVFSNAATGDLGIVEANADLMVARLNDVLKDMFGNDRNNPTYAGACEPVAVTAITGVPATLTLEEIGDTHTFTATVVPANTTFPTITWSSNNESVATVSAAGVVTAQSAGTATVTATAGGFSVNCLVTVNAAHSLSGTYRIGGDRADFASLHAACEQIKTYGLKGATTLLICADLTETANSGLVNTSDYTLTIKPDAAVKRAVSFGNAPDNEGPSGHVMIGYKLSGWTSTDTKNIIIDGSYNGEGQYLEFSAGSVGGRTMVFYGNVTNTEVRNCRIINNRASGTNYAIELRTAKSTDKHADGIVIENNYIEATGSANTQTIVLNGSEESTASGHVANTVIRNNEIASKLRGIFFNKANNATIEGNTFRMPSASGGFLAHAIMGNAQTGTIIVRDNKFVELKTTNTTAGAYGIRAITADGGATKWVIENNYFGGLEATENVASKNVLLEYIYCDDLCEIRHNTFYMPSLSHSPATALNSATPVSCVQLKSSAAHIVKNNIFVSEETTAHNSLISGTLNDNILSNVFYHHGGNAALTSSGSAIGDLDASNKWMQVAFTETYKLDFESANNSLIAVTPISGITTDIEGRTRTNPTHAGCYEPSWGLVLNEEADDNTDAIDDKDGQTMDVLLKRHFLVEDGMYTLVLPFDLDDEQLQEAFGAGYKLSVMQDAYYKSADVLYLKFGFVNHLEAGVPCLLQVGTDVTEDILFRDVTIDNRQPVNDQDIVKMIGLYDMTEVAADVRNYYLGSGDYLFQYKTTIATKGFRSYFHFPGFATSAPPRVARVIFHEEVATDDMLLESTPATAEPEKIIRDGEILIIVNGVEYDMMGRPRVK